MGLQVSKDKVEELIQQIQTSSAAFGALLDLVRAHDKKQQVGTNSADTKSIRVY